MYICVCHALTDGDVRVAEAAGAATHGQVFRHFGVKMQCGRCASAMSGALCRHPVNSERRHADDVAEPVGHSRRQDR